MKHEISWKKIVDSWKIREKTCDELFKRLMEEERRRQMKDMMMMASSPTQIQVGFFSMILSDS